MTNIKQNVKRPLSVLIISIVQALLAFVVFIPGIDYRTLADGFHGVSPLVAYAISIAFLIFWYGIPVGMLVFGIITYLNLKVKRVWLSILFTCISIAFSIGTVAVTLINMLVSNNFSSLHLGWVIPVALLVGFASIPFCIVYCVSGKK